LSPSSIGEVSIITLVALTLVALNPLAFFITLVAVVFTTLAIAFRGCLLSAANARPLAARLSSADAGATAASCPPAEPLLPFVALYFIMADCYVIALAPAPSSHCYSRRHHCHCFVIVTARQHLLTNPLEEEKGRKSLFLFTAQQIEINKFRPSFSKSKYIKIAHKNQNRIMSVTHWVVTKIAINGLYLNLYTNNHRINREYL
jgi:hypothetical protein